MENKIRQFKKKPVVVSAVLYNDTTDLKLLREFGAPYTLQGDKLSVYNSEEKQFIHVPEGHYIIRGVNGEYYPCSPDVMQKTYDKMSSLGG